VNEESPSSTPDELPATNSGFLIAAAGGSAGALEAFTDFLRAIRADTPVAIVLVQHLSAEHESLLVELLARVTPMPVSWASRDTKIEPGRVYVMPPKSMLTLRGGSFVMQNAAASRGGIIDNFLSSLAADAGHRAVAVIFSGNGTDGAHGLRAIAAAGGTVFAEREDTAAFPAMPRAAIETGCVDGVLTPQEIAVEISRIANNCGPLSHTEPAVQMERPEWEAEALRQLFRRLKSWRGVDFTDYKQTTIKRRIFRRMLVTRCDSMADYLALVEKSAAELDALFDSLLINVTEFFRDPETFEHLSQHILPDLIERVPQDGQVRIWVPGCSTGQEAYSLAMLVRETLDSLKRTQSVQIFGTDLSEHAIAVARAGIYSAAEVSTMSPERLSRFFEHRGGSYSIRKSIRDLCIFARQNVVKDAPFSRMDLISCRNLLIYFDTKLQQKVLPIFHYALNPHGILTLGSSESVGGYTDLFRPLDRRHRIYARTMSGRRTSFDFLPVDGAETPPRLPPSPTHMASPPDGSYDLIHEADRIVVEHHAPPGVLVTANFEAVQFRGDVSAYLSPYSGHASLHLFKIARDGLSGELETALLEVQKTNTSYRKEGITVVHGERIQQFILEVSPVEAANGERGYLVHFLDIKPSPSEQSVPAGVTDNAALFAQIEQLKIDLRTARGHLHSALKKHEVATEEARRANEEIQSSNEELQSTNEELETAKEELQSTNEELATVNQELHSRQLELIQVNNDLTNLINSVQIPVIILTDDLRIRRFTTSAETVLNLIPADVGRPLSDINMKLKLPDLPHLVSEVTASLTLREIEAQDVSGRWFSVRIRPYKTAENKIEGVVISMMDIDGIKRAQTEAADAREVSEAILNTTADPMVVLDANLRIHSANESFHRLFPTSGEQVLQQSFLAVLGEVDQASALRRGLQDVLPAKNPLRNFPVSVTGNRSRPQDLTIDARPITRGGRDYPLILVTVHRANSSAD
jgi:two-component system CheB/CheR fusion protein